MPFGRSRRWRSGSGAAVGTAAFLAILVFAGLLAQRFPHRFDLTAQGVQSLSDETIAVLRHLDQNVRAIAFPDPAKSSRDRLSDLLERYHVANHRFTYELVDADRKPALAKQYNITAYDTIVLTSGTRTQNVSEPTEEAITNGLQQISLGRVRKVYFTTGHGEHPFEEGTKGSYSSAKRDIVSAGFPVDTLNLLTTAKVPDDAGAVIVAGPRKDFLPAEVESLGAYVRSGGSLLVLLDPGTDAGLEGLLSTFGIEVGNDLVIDKLSRVFGGDDATPVVTQYGTNPAVRGFRVATFFPEARSVRPAASLPKGVTAETLAATSNQAWAETNADEIKKGEVTFDSGKDVRGPVPLAVAATVPAETKTAASKPGEAQAGTLGDAPAEGKVIVFGDSDFAADAAFSLSGNSDLFLNVIEYLARKNPLVIQHRTREGTPLFLTAGQGGLLAFYALLLGPGAVLLAGGLVWRARRKHR